MPLLALGMASLLAGLWAGLGKIEWVPTGEFSAFPSLHGVLMTAGFLGTLISLERAVALGSLWAYGAPLLSGLGAVSLLAGASNRNAGFLFSAGAFVFLLASYALMNRQRNVFTALLTAAAACLLAGNGSWCLSDWHFRVALWWMAFLLLTIVGERLELSQFALFSQPLPVRAAMAVSVAAFLAGAALVSFDLFWGFRLSGAAMALLAVWLLRYDVANRNLRQQGLTRFMAACLIPGYAWLLVSGLIIAGFGPVESGFPYDAALHSFFLGFAVSMIFAHAPVIFPAITRVPVPYRTSFYAHLALLQAGLLIRVGSDLLSWEEGRRWGGLLNALAFLVFFGNTLYAAASSRRDRSQG